MPFSMRNGLHSCHRAWSFYHMSITTIHASAIWSVWGGIMANDAIKEEYETLPKVTYLLKLCQLGAMSDDEYKTCLVPREYKLQVWLNNISLQVWDL